MAPKEKLMQRLASLKWKQDAKGNLKSSSLSQQDADQLDVLAALHLDTHHTIGPGIQPESFSLQFPVIDLPRLVAHGLKFPGSETIPPESLSEEE